MGPKRSLVTAEYNALYLFYNSTNGKDWRWTNLTQSHIAWDFSDPSSDPCSNNWQGVACTCPGTTCHLQSLRLQHRNLSGTLPESIGDWPLLQLLALRFNNISQSIPQTIGNLSALSFLDFGYNQLTGSLPLTMTKLIALKNLDLSSNWLSGSLPEVIFKLTSLESLILTNNFFQGSIRPDIGNLTVLRTLQLALNDLCCSLPDSIGNLQALQSLDLSSTLITGTLPESLFTLQNLNSLVILTANITGTLSDKIGNLKNLVNLELGNNRLSGSIPASFGQLTNLKALELNAQYFTGTLPSSLFNLTKLIVLYLQDNQLWGNITPIASFPHLRVVSLWYNFFTGSYPISEQQFSIMQYLSIGENFLSGGLPWISNVSLHSPVKIFRSEENYFTGLLPQRVINAIEMTFFAVSGNYLMGNISTVLFNGSCHVIAFGLSNNLLTGTLPVEISNQTTLRQLSVGGNFLTGTIPGELANIKELVVLQLDHNQFVGTIPTQFQDFAYLQELFLQGNQLTGDINVFFNQTRSSRFFVNLDISGNHFTGTLPAAFFQEATAMESFSASSNCITSSIPEAVCAMTSLESLSLDGLMTAENCRAYVFPGLSHYLTSFTVKQFIQGTVPPCLFDLPRISTLHLSGNGLTGSIPAKNVQGGEFNFYLNFDDLSLSHNLLSGTIPLAFQTHHWLSLDLSYNKLSGSLSPRIFAPPMGLSLQVNRLSGSVPDSLSSLPTISVLDGNIFQCDQWTRRGLPANDTDYQNYSCGSDSVDNVLYAWIAACSLVPLLLLLLYRLASSKYLQKEHSYPRVDLGLRRLIQKVQKYRTLLRSLHFAKTNSLSRLSHYFHDIRTVSVILMAFSIFVLLPVYIVLKQYYASYSSQYSWSPSAMLLSGEIAAEILFVFFAVCAAIFLLLMKHLHHRIQRVDESFFQTIRSSLFQREELKEEIATKLFDSGSNSPSLVESRSQQTQRYLLPELREASLVYIIIAFLDVLVMSASDFSYVYIVVNYSALISAFAAFSLASFRIMTNHVLLWTALPFTVKLFRSGLSRYKRICSNGSSLTPPTTTVPPAKTADSTTEGKGEGKGEDSVSADVATNVNIIDGSYSARDLSFLENVILFNNIIIPGLAIIFILPDCFYNALFAPDPVTSSYNYNTCNVYNPTQGTSHGCQFATELMTYSPPFIYSYQCSSKIVMNYVPVYILFFLMTCFLIPLAKLLIKAVYDVLNERKKKGDASPREEVIRQSIEYMLLPVCFRPLYPSSSYQTTAVPSPPPRLFSKLALSVQINSSLTIMICFGALFPPLAVIAGIAICSLTYYEEACIGWLLKKTRALPETEKEEYRWVEEQLQREYQGVEESNQVMIWSTLVVACGLFGYILFDTGGDTSGWIKALPLCLVMLAMPLWLLFFSWLFGLRRLRDLTSGFCSQLRSQRREVKEDVTVAVGGKRQENCDLEDPEEIVEKEERDRTRSTIQMKTRLISNAVDSSSLHSSLPRSTTTNPLQSELTLPLP